jgi:ribosomal protein S6--L-glutamate ligase
VLPFKFPFVFKFAWGGEGEGVFSIQSAEDFEAAIKKVALYEKSGSYGFLLQEYIHSDKTLRLVRIGESTYSYWRVQDRPDAFGSSLSQGAHIDTEAEPGLVAVASKHLNQFCRKTNINLAGFDAIFASHGPEQPLFLEINYFFGRRGLGGSEKYYQILETEIKQWLDRHGLSVGQV